MNSVPTGAGRLHRVDQYVLAALLATATATAYDGMFVDRRYLVAAGASSLVVSLVVWALRNRVRTVGAQVLVAMGVIGACLTVVAAASPSGDGALGTLRDAWGRTLSTAVPLGHEDGFLVVPAALTAATAAASAILVGRSRHPAVPLVPVAPALVAGLVIAAPGRPPVDLLAATVTIGAVVLCAVRALPDGPARARPTVAGFVVTVVALAAVGAATAADTLRNGDTPALRDLTGPIQEDLRALSPLVDFKADLQREPPLPLVEIRGTDIPTYVRLASFDEHDGVVWSTTGRFERTASEIATPTWMAGAGTRTGRWTFRLDELDEVFLPTVGEPLQVDGTEARVDVKAGDLLAVEDDRTYRVTAMVPPEDRDVLAEAAVADDAGLDRYLALPEDLPEVVESQATRLTDAGETDYERLTDLETGLRDEHGYNESVPAGHGLAQIERFLVEQVGRVDKLARRGTAEQFATTFVLMARTLDIPARLAVGFQRMAEEDEAADPDAPASVTLGSDDLHVWAEVPFEGIGWVPFDPTPERRRSDPPQLPGADAPDAATAFIIEDPDAELSEPLLDLDAGGDGGLVGVDTPTFAALALVVVTIGLLAVIVLLKQRRRLRRRTARRPEERIVGAWDEVRDRLVEVGFGRRRYLSAHELADAAPPFAGVDAAARLVDLAPLVDLAVYGRDAATPAHAEQAWAITDEFRAAVGATRSLPRRVADRIDPRPLFRRRH